MTRRPWPPCPGPYQDAVFNIHASGVPIEDIGPMIKKTEGLVRGTIAWVRLANACAAAREWKPRVKK